jgi:hypothetical protein
MPREIITDWTTPAGSGFVSVNYWILGLSVADQRQDWQDFLEACATTLDDGTSWNIRPVGRELNDVTGTLEDEWNEPTDQSGTGANSGDAVPDASQVLVRWNTSQIVGGRFLRGRTFLPGASTAAVDEGNVLPANVLAITTAANLLVAAAGGPGVWHRPVNGAGGEFHVATSGQCWSEFAVLRQRRK